MNLWQASDQAGRRWCLGYTAVGVGMIGLAFVATWWWLELLCAAIWFVCAYWQLQIGARRAERKRFIAQIDAYRENWWRN